SPCPVLAVAEDCCETPRTVVVAIDFSAASLHAARQALPLLSDGAVVHLVHAWRRHIPPVPTTRTDPFDDAYEHALPARFDLARAALGRERSLVFLCTATEGDAATVVLDAARTLRADLVVAGAQGHGVVERLLVGSVSTALLRGAACSVLVAPEPPPAERTRLERHMTGTSTIRAPEEWAEVLDAFSRRNRSRRTALEIDDVSLGSQVQESGYTLLGATYDHHDRHVSLMFADPVHPEAHLTRTLGKVRSVAVSQSDGGDDGALCIESEQGSTLLTFLDRPAG
ncbi:MAG TPA: universal stress protein, partial [Gemmatimonadaceae bacterium]|nr:universal stress protein [Gemmatimonadaceae bacterium]